MTDYSPTFLQNYASQFASENGIDPNFVLAQIGQESSWNPSAYNPAGPSGGAMGLGQFIQPTANAYGVNPYDPLSSIHGVVNYDSDLLSQCGGDYVCVAQKYGTLPSDLSSLSSGQQSVLSAAQSASPPSMIDQWEAVGGCLMNAWSMDAISACMNPTTAAKANANGQSACATLDFVCQIKSSGLDFLSIIVGLILVASGLFMLKSGASPVEIVSAARGALADSAGALVAA